VRCRETFLGLAALLAAGATGCGDDPVVVIGSDQATSQGPKLPPSEEAHECLDGGPCQIAEGCELPECNACETDADCTVERTCSPTLKHCVETHEL